jgi:hypothetical protein
MIDRRLFLVFARNTYANSYSEHKEYCDKNAGFHAVSPFLSIFLKPKKESSEIDEPMKNHSTFKAAFYLQQCHRQTKKKGRSGQ